MTVLEYIILLFKRPGVQGENEKKKLLNSLKPMTEIFTFKLEQPLHDRITFFRIQTFFINYNTYLFLKNLLRMYIWHKCQP